MKTDNEYTGMKILNEIAECEKFINKELASTQRSQQTLQWLADHHHLLVAVLRHAREKAGQTP